MKRYAILTSVLALAACGGGSSHHGGGAGIIAPDAVVTPSDMLSSEQRAAAIKSNENITQMDSFIVVGGANPTVNTNARAGGVKMADGGVRYDLSDVEFKAGSMLLNTGADDRGSIKFHTDNGRIEKIEITNEVLHAITNRNDEGNSFSGEYTCVETDDEGNEVVEKGELDVLYTSKSKNHDVGLRYSDFGVIEWGEAGMYDTANYFAGGYAPKEIKSADIKGTMEFSGVADGVVMIGDFGDDAESFDKENTLRTSAEAKIVFNNGTSVLTANFADWYDVTATMDNTGNLTDLQFANGDKDGFYSSEKYDFKWHGQDNYTALATAEDKDAICPSGDCWNGTVRDGFIEYYGDGTNPAEAVGVVKYGDTQGTVVGSNDTGDLRTQAMRFDMGFGAKRDK